MSNPRPVGHRARWVTDHRWAEAPVHPGSRSQTYRQLPSWAPTVRSVLNLAGPSGEPAIDRRASVLPSHGSCQPDAQPADVTSRASGSGASQGDATSRWPGSGRGNWRGARDAVPRACPCSGVDVGAPGGGRVAAAHGGGGGGRGAPTDRRRLVSSRLLALEAPVARVPQGPPRRVPAASPYRRRAAAQHRGPRLPPLPLVLPRVRPVRHRPDVSELGAVPVRRRVRRQPS